MILRLPSGALTPDSASRKVSAASTVTRLAPVAATKSRCTCARSPARNSPWSTKTQVNRSPMARCTRAAATAESTPPDSPQMAWPSPIWVRTCSISALAMLAGVHWAPSPAKSCKNRLSTCCPCGVCITSG
ncbi:Uncharacterised protein [Mycobacterium tuberculosis]|uniref:Uncharacterized protein n=1 Tax=Mycobacterium tuberculosis TaxID=1773 RepID=A0A0T9F8V9_MYCTX|nr:Uncharacterised protein [Mycobacterium tuberculosis]CKV20546.1 Uncharacterised protein [Mycobacterium tuberculosis]COW01024.1 Uncharacterised protein [Mycobacterium tuberculosis]